MDLHHGKTARYGGVLAALLASITLLAAACGSPGSHGAQRGSTATPSNGVLAFSHCMRSHAVPSFPDPTGSGSIPKETAQQLGVSGSQYQAAQRACQHLLPDSGGLSQADVQQAWSGTLSFARCMRSHGVSNWPDPADDGTGSPVFYLQGKIDPNTPQVVTKIHACQQLIPPGYRSFGGSPGGVRMCPGDKPDPATQTSACR